MDKSQLKIQALLERITEITTQYENRCADYRVEITTLTSQVNTLNEEVEKLRNELASNVGTQEPPYQHAELAE